MKFPFVKKIKVPLKNEFKKFTETLLNTVMMCCFLYYFPFRFNIFSIFIDIYNFSRIHTLDKFIINLIES